MQKEYKELEQRLTTKLHEIFGLDKADLDFGIYKLINFKRQEIETFINEVLLKNLREGFEENGLSYQERIQVLNNLLLFFSRYYSQGDFLPKGRYGSREKYFLPYNGEETKLCWANQNQFYVKTTDFFHTYKFRYKDFTVYLKVKQAQEEKNNKKSQEKKFFVLHQKQPFSNDEVEQSVEIFFEYRTVSKQEAKEMAWGDKKGAQVKQEKINTYTIEQLCPLFQESGLTIPCELLNRHLNNFSRRNTKDYFIHQKLREFLYKELDFFIKDQLLDLSGFEPQSIDKQFKFYGIFRIAAASIIDLLAQIEDFQKKLWQKKKIIIDTHYVVTLDKLHQLAQDFLEQNLEYILANKKQVEEWQNLFGESINSLHDVFTDEKQTKIKSLPLDTKFFDSSFKYKLLAAISSNVPLEESLDGILIKSENWQALNLLQKKYREKIRTIYIDPPFNKGQEADYLYKVGYKDSAWITLLENRLTLAKNLVANNGSIFVRCDYNGNMYVRMLLNQIFGADNFRNEFIVSRGAPKAGLLTQFDGIKSTSVAYDNLYWYSKNPEVRFKGFYKPAPKEKQENGFWADFKKGENYDRPTMRYEILGINIDKGQWKWSKQRAMKAVENYQKYLNESEKTGETLEQYWKRTGEKLEFIKRQGDKIKYWVSPRKELMVDNNWLDIAGYSSTTGFQTENAEVLLKRVILYTSRPKEFVMDFFSGSGTTVATAHKLRRKWIGVEMGEHFDSVILPRMKKVLFYDAGGISKDKDVKVIYNKNNAGGFFKYHTLEQYEDTLENITFSYEDKELYSLPDYISKYFLEHQSQNSKTLLQQAKISSPFVYKIKIVENYQTVEKNVDLAETFVHLTGFYTEKIFIAEHQQRTYLFYYGRLNRKPALIIWRNSEGIDYERESVFLEQFLQQYKPAEIFINSDSLLAKGNSVEHVLYSSILQ